MLLQRLVAHYDIDDLLQLPNFAYSTRLAEFREQTGHTADKQGQGSGFASSSCDATPAPDGELTLAEKLAQAVMLYPGVVVRLMDKYVVIAAAQAPACHLVLQLHVSDTACQQGRCSCSTLCKQQRCQMKS